MFIHSTMLPTNAICGRSNIITIPIYLIIFGIVPFMGTKLVTFLCYCVKYKGAKNRMLVKYSQNVRVYILCPIFFARKTILFKASMRDFIIMILFCSRRIICCRANIYNYQIAKFFVKKHKKCEIIIICITGCIENKYFAIVEFFLKIFYA